MIAAINLPVGYTFAIFLSCSILITRFACLSDTNLSVYLSSNTSKFSSFASKLKSCFRKGERPLENFIYGITTLSCGSWMSLRLAVIKAELKTSSRNSHSCNDASKGMLKGKPLKMFWKGQHIVWIRDRPATRFKRNIIFLLSCLPKGLRKLELYRRSDVNSSVFKCKPRVRIHQPFGTFIGVQLKKLLSGASQLAKINEGVGGGEILDLLTDWPTHQRLFPFKIYQSTTYTMWLFSILSSARKV